MSGVSAAMEKLIGSIELSTRDYREARTMPPACYTSAEFYELEKEAVFGKEWLCIGHHNQIPEPGDYFTLTIFDEPLVAIRQEDLSIKVLSAVCRHRGFPVATGKNHEKRNCRALSCPYHKWTYGIDGKLHSAPLMRDTVDLETLRQEEALPELKVEIVQGMIFTTLNPDPAPLKPTLAKWEAEVARYNLADMEPMPTLSTEALPYNWKILHENALEPYHTLFIHAGVHDMAPASRATFMDWEDGDGQIMHPTGFNHPDGGFNPSEKASFPVIPGLGEKERTQVLFGSVPPTLFFAFMPDQVFSFIILPNSAESTTLLLNWFFPKETKAWKHFQWAFDAQSSINDFINIQDQDANLLLQQGLRSRFAPRGRYCRLETTLPQFNSWLLARLKSHLAASKSETRDVA